MKDQRIYKALVFLLLFAIATTIIYLSLKKEKAQIVFNAKAPYVLYMKNKEHEVKSDSFKLSSELGKFWFLARKDGYKDIPGSFLVDSYDEREISLDFVYQPNIKELYSTKGLRPRLRSHFHTAECPAKLDFEEKSIFYCYDASQEKGTVFYEESADSTKVVATIFGIPFAGLALSAQKDIVLLYPSLDKNNNAYLVDLETGRKEELWQNENVTGAYFTEGHAVIFERMSGEGELAAATVELVYVDTKTKTQRELGINSRLSDTCVLNDKIYYLDEERELQDIAKSSENIFEMFGELASIVSNSQELGFVQVLKSGNIKDETVEEVLLTGSYLENLSCDTENKKIYLESMEDEKLYEVSLKNPLEESHDEA